MGVSPSCSAGILLSHVSVLSFQGLKIEACRKRTENGHLLPNNTGLVESSLPGRKALYLVVRMKAPPGGFTDLRAMVRCPKGSGWAQAALKEPRGRFSPMAPSQEPSVGLFPLLAP